MNDPPANCPNKTAQAPAPIILNVPIGDGYTGDRLSVQNTLRRPSESRLVEAVQDDQSFMDDHEVAANEDGARDGRQVQLVFVPDANAVCRWAVSAERFDPVDHHPNREPIGLYCK